MLIQPLLIACLFAPTQTEPAPQIAWNAQTAEHLLSRAGFGASRQSIALATDAGLQATVDGLFSAREIRDPYLVVRSQPSAEELAELTIEERRSVLLAAGRASADQLRDYRLGWFERLLENDDPLRERMLLFWHGFFTTSASVVVESDKVLHQVEMLREGALGSYAELLQGIVRDPAMLEYLDNDENRKKWANENLARELMELFSLGEGNYTEADVKAAARALTGRRAGEDGLFEFRRSDHDSALKTIFGVEKRFDGDRLVDLLLEQEACARWLAGRLLEYFEGRVPSNERLVEYAELLRKSEYGIEPFLRRLFTDPAFYRDEIMGARVTSPIDLMIGTCLRVGLDPSPIFFVVATSLLGQELMQPPNVKGWEEGEAWISTSTLMMRGNLQGLLLGTYELEGTEAEIVNVIGQSFARESRTLKKFGESRYRPRINFSSRLAKFGRTSDRRIVEFLIEELLATPVEESAQALLVEFLVEERVRLEIEEGQVHLSGPSGEALLRRLAHLILSLPEAQLS